MFQQKIYFEIAEKIKEKFTKEVAEAFLDALTNCPFVISSEPFYKWNMVDVDPDDNKYI